jgi:hypothetical protein
MTNEASIFGLRGAFIVVLLFVISCTPWRVTYLSDGLNTLTQDDVTQRFGPPHRTQDLMNGSVVWSYQYESTSAISVTAKTRNAPPPPSSHGCVEYILTFDSDHILRSWIRQGC